MIDRRTHPPLVGTGGWAYFQVPGLDSLHAYSSVFDFVEVNSTYYEHPEPRIVSNWRSRVPRRFEFSVLCHKDIVRALRHEEDHLIDHTVDKMSQICQVLDANILSVLLPSKLGVTNESLANQLKHIASAFKSRKTQLAVEIRTNVAGEVLDAMVDSDIIHCVDISKEPAPESRVLYSRLFGKGQDNIYQFDDEEIKGIAEKAGSPKFDKSILAFHGVRMYGDAARLKAFLQTGRFLQVTGQTGLDSLGDILKEDATFPESKEALIARQGWKLFDLTINKRVRAGKVLSMLPDRTYRSHRELLDYLKPFVSNPDL